MSKNLSQQKRGTPLNPSEGGSEANNPQKEREQPKQKPQEGDYRNVETSVNNPSYFDDDYEAKQEDEISKDEAGRAKENREADRKQKH